MAQKSTWSEGPSRVCWESLEEFARGQIQGWLQALLEEEVTELLGRNRYERKGEVDAPEGYRNGYGKERRVSLSCGTVRVRRPRVRGLEERFESRILPLFKRRTREVGDLIPELYLHGLAEGDFELALRGLLGDGAPLSGSSVSRLKAKWQGEYQGWMTEDLSDLDVVYMWADGVYVKAGLEKEKAALLVVLVALRDGTKRIVALEAGHRESTQSWAGVLRGLKRRGLRCPRLVIADGHLGIWGGLTNVFPEAQEQRCWNHKMANVLDRIPKKLQVQAKVLLRQIVYAPSRKKADRRKSNFEGWCQAHGLDKAASILNDDWERMVSFYRFPKKHWKHLRTSNPIESIFASVRLRTNAAKRYKKVPNATAVIWKTLQIAEKRFRRLDAPHLLSEVACGVVYVDGVRSKKGKKEAAA